MILSLNEIEGAAGKAARGAGLSWGLAEEAAGASRWLAAHGLDWLPALLDVLEGASASGDAVLDGTTIRPRDPGTLLCPLQTGAYLADLGTGAVPVRLLAVRRPLYLLPFAARIARRAGAALTIDTGPARVWLDDQGLRAAAAGAHALAAAAGDVSLALAPAAGAPATAAPLPAVSVARAVDAALWQRLAAWEARTYVPASEHSRIAGAGAGLTDND